MFTVEVLARVICFHELTHLFEQEDEVGASEELVPVTSRNTLDRADSSRAVHMTSRTRHRLPVAPGQLGPVPRAWNLSP